MPTPEKTAENQTLLLVCPNRHDLKQITADLVSRGLHLEKTANEKEGESFFETLQPAVLLLRFSSLDKAVAYRDRLPQIDTPTQTIILCNRSESDKAVSLVKQQVIGGYFLFQPVFDWNALEAAIVQARFIATTLATARRGGQQLDVYKGHLQKLNDRFRQFRQEVLAGEHPSTARASPQSQDESGFEAQGAEPKPIILVIEEKVGELEFISSILRHQGYRVLQAISRIQVISHLAQKVKVKPELILLSQDLTGLSGLQLAERFGTQTHLKSIPILLMTEQLTPPVVRQAQHLGLRGVLTKPIDEKKMLQQIEHALADPSASFEKAAVPDSGNGLT